MSVMISKRRNRVHLQDRDGYTVLDLGPIEIWDGTDLALIRDMIVETIEKGAQSVGVDMSHVKYIPSGFFGMMFDWLEKGIPVRLYTPQPNVADMLWFRQFFVQIRPGVFEMTKEAQDDSISLGQPSASRQCYTRTTCKSAPPKIDPMRLVVQSCLVAAQT